MNFGSAQPRYYCAKTTLNFSLSLTLIQTIFLGRNWDIIKSSQASGEEEVVGMAISNQFIEDLFLTYVTKRTDLEV